MVSDKDAPSALLFVLIVEPLLRRLSGVSNEITTRAFADDIAMVVPDIDKHWGEIAKIFDEFAELSGLKINVNKTFIMPLGQLSVDSLGSEDWFSSNGAWAATNIVTKEKHLGVIVGPGATALDSYLKPIDKLSSRISWWVKQGLSMMDKCTVWNSYLLPIIGYVDQVRLQPEETNRDISRTLLSLVRGAGNWIPMCHLSYLNKMFGFPLDLRCAMLHNIAALCRVRCVAEINNPNIHALHQESMRSGSRTGGYLFNHGWFHIEKGWQMAQSIIGDLSDIKRNPIKYAFPNRKTVKHNKNKVGFAVQKAFYTALSQKWILCQTSDVTRFPADPDPLRYVRPRWEKYFNINSSLNLRILIDRSIKNCIKLKGLVPPRVQAAWVRMLYHAWPTKLRMEQTFVPCYMCGYKDGDTFRHISCCKYTRGLYKHFNICPHNGNHSNTYFYGCQANLEGDTLVVSSLILAGIYSALNALRNGKIQGNRFGLSLLGHVSEASENSAAAVTLRRWRSRYHISVTDDTSYLAYCT